MSFLDLSAVIQTREQIVEIINFMLNDTVGGRNVLGHIPCPHQNVNNAATSCAANAAFMGTCQQVVSNIRTHGVPLNNVLNDIQRALQGGNGVSIKVNYASGGDHWFNISSSDNGVTAKIVHAYEEHHHLRAERSMNLGDLINNLRRAMEGDAEAHTAIFKDTPQNGAMRFNNVNVVRSRFNPHFDLAAGDHNFTDRSNGVFSRLGRLNKNMLDRAAQSDAEFAYWRSRTRLTYGGLTGGVFAFAISAALVYNDTNKTAGQKREKVAFDTVVGAGAGVAAKASTRAAYVPSTKVAGGLMGAERGVMVFKNSVRGCAAATVVVSVGQIIYGTIQYNRGNWSIVEYRKKNSGTIGGGIGGVLGTVVLAGGAVFFLPEAIIFGGVCAIVGGIGGGIGGYALGEAVDAKIWNSDLDALEHLFWFFRLGKFFRNKPIKDQRPNTQAKKDEWLKCMENRFDEADAIEDEEKKKNWKQICLSNFIDFQRRMFEERWAELEEVIQDISELLNETSEQTRSFLNPGDKLFSEGDNTLFSENGKYSVVMQSDGNLVLYEYKEGGKRTAKWASGTHGKGTAPYKLKYQHDGNLVVYDSKNTSLWSSKTRGKSPFKAVIQNDRNFVVYKSAPMTYPNAVFATGTR